MNIKSDIKRPERKYCNELDCKRRQGYFLHRCQIHPELAEFRHGCPLHANRCAKCDAAAPVR